MHRQGTDTAIKNTISQGILVIPCLRACFVLFAVLFSITAVYAEELIGEKAIATDNGSIIITASEGNPAVIQSGNITAAEGSSVRLLPGTHIRAGDELTVSIVSREYYDGLAEQAAEEEQKRVVASILERHESPIKPVKAAVMLRLPSSTGRRSQVQQQLNLHAALPARDQNTNKFGIVMNRLQTYQSGDCIIPQTTLNNPYLPSQSWGNRGEVVAVMRT
jgi:hypothetical protein